MPAEQAATVLKTPFRFHSISRFAGATASYKAQRAPGAGSGCLLLNGSEVRRESIRTVDEMEIIMKRPNIIRYSLLAAGTIAALFGGVGAWAETATPQTAPPAATAGGGAPPRPLTTEERDRFRKEMAGAKTAEEREKVRAEHRALIEQRAKEKGVTLPPQGMGPYGAGGGNGRGNGQRYAQLMTPEERQQFRSQMLSAQTPEERQKIREQHRAVMQQRAIEHGMTPPDARGPGVSRGGPAGGGPAPAAPAKPAD